ncbi:hypothetical protein F5146DRAFT_1004856 [Armillaria mellea]|nr:hypothetical protein F5146DRAFT_1004856 [Armillaria mellea]
MFCPMKQQELSSTQDLLILTTAQILDYFWMPDGLLDSPCLLKSYQALNKSTQLQVNKLIKKNQLLEMSMPAHSKKGHNKSLTPEQTSDIRHFTQHCVAMIDPWTEDANIFQACESIDNKLILSPDHSTCINRVKNEAFHTIFGALLPPLSMGKGFDPFSDPVCQQLLGFDAEKKILLAIFFGATSIKERKVTRMKPTNAVLWKLEQITPGAIAFVAIMAHYVLSGDRHFDMHGACLLIPYAADFKFYKMTIIKNLNETYMMETITMFNHHLFQGRGLNRGDQSCSNEYKIIEIGNNFTDSSGSDDDPFDVQVIENTIACNSELVSATTVDDAVDELVSSIAGVALDTAALLETDHSATGPENRSQVDVVETGRIVPSEGSKQRGSVQEKDDMIIEEDDVYGS